MSAELLGYLLGALEPEEAAAIAARLEVDADLRRELEFLRAQLAPLTDDRQYVDPPEGLAERVSESVADLGDRKFAAAATPLAAPVATSWSRIDAATIVGLSLAALVLFVPVLASNRYRAQAVACRQRLHEVGQALVNYSRTRSGLFPEVPSDGNLARAGVYAVRLREAGYLADEQNVYCPTIADNRNDLPFVPTLATLQSAAPDEAEVLFGRMNGSFGYALGYVDGGRYHALRNRDRSTFAVLADSLDVASGGNRNHGCGQNVWFEDGHAEFLNCCRLNVRDDHLYENHEGFVGAGIGADDVVIGAPHAQPHLTPVSLGK